MVLNSGHHTLLSIGPHQDLIDTIGRHTTTRPKMLVRPLCCLYALLLNRARVGCYHVWTRQLLKRWSCTQDASSQANDQDSLRHECNPPPGESGRGPGLHQKDGQNHRNGQKQKWGDPVCDLSSGIRETKDLTQRIQEGHEPKSNRKGIRAIALLKTHQTKGKATQDDQDRGERKEAFPDGRWLPGITHEERPHTITAQ